MFSKKPKEKKEKPQKAAKNKKKQKQPQEPQWLLNPLKNEVLNYRVYKLNAVERMLYSLMAFAVGGLVGLLFYGGLFKVEGVATLATYISNVIVFVVVGVVAIKVFLPVRAEQLMKKRQKALRIQFRDMLESITVSLSANNTVIQAFDDAYQDMRVQYSEEAYITQELFQLVQARKNNVDMVLMIEDLAKRSACEDIENFSNVFKVSLGPGGRMKEIMRYTHDLICDKIQIEDEIESKMSANRLELNVITVAPVFIVGMLRFSNASFAENFASPAGVLSMTVGIAMFVLAYRMGQKIVNFGE